MGHHDRGGLVVLLPICVGHNAIFGDGGGGTAINAGVVAWVIILRKKMIAKKKEIIFSLSLSHPFSLGLFPALLTSPIPSSDLSRNTCVIRMMSATWISGYYVCHAWNK